MEVEFTDPAAESLRNIYCHCPENVAGEIVEKILQRAETLSSLADWGRIVEELRLYNQGHRYILQGNYKIIYLQKGNTVYIMDVFNMSQDPDTISQRHQE